MTGTEIDSGNSNNGNSRGNSDAQVAWKPISHEHHVYVPLNKDLAPCSSPPAGKSSGMKERLAQAKKNELVRNAMMAAKHTERNAAAAATTTAASTAAMEITTAASFPPASLTATATSTAAQKATVPDADTATDTATAASNKDINKESQEYYLDKRTIAAIAAKDSQAVYTRSAIGDVNRSKKSTRYFKEYILANPLQYSKDFIPPPPHSSVPVPASNAMNINTNTNTEGAGTASTVDQELTLKKRRSMHSSVMGLTTENLDEAVQEEKRNDRFSRKALRQQAALELPDEAYVPQMAANQHFLRHTMLKRDSSNSGYINFDEFKCSLKKADILLTHEEYMSVFNKFTSNSNSQAPVPVRTASCSPRSSSPPLSGGRLTADQLNGMPADEQALRERFKGVIGVMSTGKVLNIEDFIDTVQTKAKNIAVSSSDTSNSTNNSNIGGSRDVKEMAHNALNKEKRRIFFKVLHSINKSADPSKVFRHLDDEQLGHLRPVVLRKGLSYLGATLSDSEFNTLLRGVGYNDPQGKSYIDLDVFDQVLHSELSGSGSGSGAEAGTGTYIETSSGSASSSSGDGKVGKEGDFRKRDADIPDQYRRTRRCQIVPGSGQNPQHHHNEMKIHTLEGLTAKITEGEAPTPKSHSTASKSRSNAFIDISEQISLLAAKNAATGTGTSSVNAIRLKKMQSILECLQPHTSEFTRMVESQHTKDSSMKWSKLKWALQSDPQRVLQSFQPTAISTAAAAGGGLAATTGSSHNFRQNQKHSVNVNQLQNLSIDELEQRLHNNGFVLGAEDRSILKFNLSKNKTQGQASGKGEGESKDNINLQFFCDTVGIALTEKTVGGTSDTSSIGHVLELDRNAIEDGGIFACSANNSTPCSSNANDSGSISSASRNYGTTVYDIDIADSWMKGMRKRHTAQATSQPNQLEPWKFLALLEHGSDAIWPTVPASADNTHKAGNSSFHFSKRAFNIQHPNPIYGELDGVGSAAAAQGFAASNGKRHFANASSSSRSSSAPPASRKADTTVAGWSNSAQFKASQAQFAAAAQQNDASATAGVSSEGGNRKAGGEDRGRGRGRGHHHPHHPAKTSMSQQRISSLLRGGESAHAHGQNRHDSPGELRKWAAQPLLEKFFPGSSAAETSDTAAARNIANLSGGTVSSRAHMGAGQAPSSSSGGAVVDSSRILHHSLRKPNPNNPNSRPATTPFALDH